MLLALTANGTIMNVTRPVARRDSSWLWLAAILLWAADIKPKPGEGLMVQLPILSLYVIFFSALFLRLRARGASLHPLRFLVGAVALYLADSITIGGISGQAAWPMISNALNSLLLLTAATVTFMVLSECNDRARFLRRLKTVCLAFIIIHFLIIVETQGLNLSTSRYQVLSGATVPAMAVLALAIVLPFGIKELMIAWLNLIMIAISVTRTELAVIAIQIFSLFAVMPSLIMRRAVIVRIVAVIVLLCSVLAIDQAARTGLATRWVERLTVSKAVGADPTALTRLAEDDYMLQKFSGTFKAFLFGNGMAAETSLIGPNAALAASIVGEGSINFHDIGYGHNNHISLLFIGGLIGGGPFLWLTFANGLSSVSLLRRLARPGAYDMTLVYIGAWGALIVIGMLVCGFFLGTFGDRSSSLWYGIGTGMLYWARRASKTPGAYA